MNTSLAPLSAVQNVGRRYPDIWNQIDEVREIGREFGYQWDDNICYCPIVTAIGALNSRQGLPKNVATGLGAYVAACAKVVDKFREVRKWDVGDRIGEQIRIIRGKKPGTHEHDETERAATGPRQYKNRPHVRRAHWAHYHVGEGRTKLVLKWINTIFVNAEDGEVGVTVQMVKKEKEKSE